MFNKIKLRLFAISFVAIAVTLIMQSTLAYYSTVGKATNVVTSGNIRLLIHETTDGDKPFPEKGVYVVPGDVVSKKVTIENDCDHPFYLRVKAVYGINSQELSADECFKLNINNSDWTLHEGWYYYNGALQPGEITSQIFSHVEIVGDKVDTSYIGKTLSLTVKAQAVQSDNNPITDDLVYTASGWPQE